MNIHPSFDPDKVIAHIAAAEQEIAQLQAIVDYLIAAHDDALRDLYTRTDQLRNFRNLAARGTTA